MHAALFAALVLTAAIDGPAQVPAQSAAVCRLSTGCTGVNVHPSGIILTAEHCGAPQNATATFEGGLGTVNLDLIYDPVKDGVDNAALFAVRGTRNDLPCVAIAECTPQVGDDVYAIGFPREGRDGPKWTMSRGTITHTNYPQVGAIVAADGVRTDFPIWGGNSGGPLFNADGDLIALASLSDRNSHSVWIGPKSISAALTQCPDGRCPPQGGIRLGPPLQIDFPQRTPEPRAPEPPLDPKAGPIDDAYDLYKFFAPEDAPPPPDAPRDAPAAAVSVQDVILIAATVAGTMFGLPWLPKVAQLLLSIFGAQITRRPKPNNGQAAE